MCKESQERAWLGGDDVVVKVAAQAPESGAGGDGRGDVPAQTPEENGDTTPDAETLRTAMVWKNTGRKWWMP